MARLNGESVFVEYDTNKSLRRSLCGVTYFYSEC